MKSDRSKKDDIILQQLEVIRTMSENNLKRMNSDFWGSPLLTPETPAGKAPETPKAPDAPRAPKAPAARDGGNGGTAASTGNDETNAPAVEEVKPKEKIEDLQAELDGYIGLAAIKREVKNLINMVTVYQLRKDNGLPTTDLSLHMVFSGNPGTGKTTVARIMARVYHSLGILSKGQLVEVDRCGLVAGDVGQTALKTQKVIEKAMGGVGAMLVMIALRRVRGLSVYGVSIAGAAAHNIGQIGAAMIVLGGTAVLGYLPVLLGVSLLTGTLTGFVAGLLFRAMKNIHFAR